MKSIKKFHYLSEIRARRRRDRAHNDAQYLRYCASWALRDKNRRAGRGAITRRTCADRTPTARRPRADRTPTDRRTDHTDRPTDRKKRPTDVGSENLAR